MAGNRTIPRFVDGPSGRQAYDQLSAAYHQTLSAPLDDMWSAFADDAEPFGIKIGDALAGCASIDPAGELHRFFIRSEFDDRADDCFQAFLNEHDVTAANVATVDPGLLSTVLPHCGGACPVALVYRWESAPEGDSLPGLRQAIETDREAAIGFMGPATGAPEPWLGGYLTERIARRELFLFEDNGQIAGSGERRFDRHAPGHAHLGIVVGQQHRGQGLGSRLMNTLVERCLRETLTPLCSTEPGNHAAQVLIRRAGFRQRHRIFRLTLMPSNRRP